MKVKIWCRIFGHDEEIIRDPRSREYRANNRPKLRKPPVKCVRCGAVRW